MAIESFLVRADGAPDAGQLEVDLRAAFERPLESGQLLDVEVRFDVAASPWHTVCEVVCEVTGPDKPGLLHTIATAFAAAGAAVMSARVVAVEGAAADRFEIVDDDGHKLDGAMQDSVRRFLEGGVAVRRSLFGRHSYTVAATPVAADRR